MNYGKIIKHDMANGPGIRTTLFVSGCYNHCPGCFNPEMQDYGYGQEYTTETLEEILASMDDGLTDGLSLLGGDVMCQDNDGIYDIAILCREVHNKGKTVWMWTGFKVEEIFNMFELCNDVTVSGTIRQSLNMLLENVDIIVDGPFIQEFQDLSLKWRGSSNQRIIDVQKSLTAGKVVERYE